MNLNAKYDVFVSYSRKDYVDESNKPIVGSAVAALLDFLDKNEITYWFDKHGIYSGSEFAETIRNAILDSKMMIYVSSEHSNASQWTLGEIFVASKYKKRIVPFKIDNSEYNEKCELLLLPLDYIEYFTNPDVAFASLHKTVSVYKDEYNKAVAEEMKRKAEEDAKQRKAKIEAEIKLESLDFQHHASTLAQDAQKLVEKQKLVGNTEKKCPICFKMQPIDNIFCKKCGWAFNPVFDPHPKGDKDHLFVMRSLWRTIKDADAVRVKLENELQELEKRTDEKERIIANLQQELLQNEELPKTLNFFKQERDRMSRQLLELQTQLKSTLDHQKELEQELSSIEEDRTRLSKLVDSVEKQLTARTVEIQKLQKELTESERQRLDLSDALKVSQEKEERDRQSKLEAERKAKEERERKAREAEVRRKIEGERGIFKIGNVEFKMIHVEGGTFMMGATPEMKDPQSNEEPVHRVALSSYYIGETPVTQALWKEVMGSNPSIFNGDDNPVNSVSWKDCQEFIKKLNKRTAKCFRLPTEAEWEFAARGGNKSKHTQYSGSYNIDDVAWYDLNSDAVIHPVKTKKSNELGIYDMSGNVWEWCHDWFSLYARQVQANPMGPTGGYNRVCRGGSWMGDDASCRLSCRTSNSPRLPLPGLGLRLALSE